MILILDTNVFFEDWYFTSPPYKALLDYVKKTSSTFWMPRVVLEELKAKFAQELDTRIANHAKLERDIYRQLNVTKDPALIFYVEKEVDTYIKYILKKLKITKKLIIEYPENVLPKLVNKAVYRIKPFTPKGEEFRDALLWESVVDSVLDPNHAEYVVFISNDSSAFGNIIHKGKEDELHPQLKEEMIKRIDEELTLSEHFKNSEDFYEKNFGYFRKINEFIGKYHTSIASFSKIWLKKQIDITDISEQLLKLSKEDEAFQKQLNRLLQRRRLGLFLEINADDFRVSIENYIVYTNSDASVAIFFEVYGYVEVSYMVEKNVTYRMISGEDTTLDINISPESSEQSSLDVAIMLSCALTISKQGQASDLLVYAMRVAG